MTHLEINKRMPFMSFNWAEHNARTSRLNLAERGMFDMVRSELWTVVGCCMPLSTLKVRLRISEGSPEAALLDTLVTLGLLRLGEGSEVYDEVQVHEFSAAVAKAAVNQANGKKGGRPRMSPSPGPQVVAARALEGDF